MERFLRSIFGEAVDDNHRLAIFTLPDRRTRHFSSPAAAAVWAREQTGTKDVYFGVGLARHNHDRRNSSSDVVAIGGFWADIDFVAPHRNGKPLPRSIGESRALLEGLPIPPTMLVDSGYGLHAYWAFKEPWVFDSEEERERAARLAKGWHGQVCRVAADLGWRIENLGDLARVLRLPGTFNRKGPQPVEIRVIEEHPDRRYNPQDFEPFEAAELPREEPTIGSIALRPDAEPPADKFLAMVTACPAFAQAWDRKRPDLADQSQSAYDQSLANVAALNDWTDQEIADLLIAARRRHGEKPEKALRRDYLARTLANARAAAQERSADGVDLSGFKIGAPAGPKSLRQIIEAYPRLRPPVIEGLLREGETLNIISAPKIGKSWLVIDLAISVATGKSWLGMECVPGEVLIIDNELHSETTANRIPRVAQARGVPLVDIHDRIYVENVRGRLQDIFALGPYFRQLAPGRFKVVILDAFYRFLPMRADENDNGTMANLYNYLDAYADHLRCSFVLIHHTSKGNQSLKELTDVGAGAGSMGRATDTHLILRRHEEDDVVVLEGAVRSWPPIVPRCMRWAFPVWQPADGLDPARLRQDTRRRGGRAEETETPPDVPAWSTAGFVAALITPEPKSATRILEEGEQAGISSRRAKRFLELAEEDGLVHRCDMGQKRVGYATEPQAPSPAAEAESIPSKRDAVLNLLRAAPESTNADIARECAVSERYVRRIRAEQEGRPHAK